MSQEPLFSVTRGVPTPEELAALVGALAMRTHGSSVAPVSSLWARSARPGPLPAGPDAWRASGLPR